MATFLLKTEPGEYAFAQLVRDGRTAWSGITNNAALAHLRSIARGDQAFIYHTGDDKAIVGLAEFVGSPYEDPARPGLNAAGRPRFAVIDVRAVQAAATPLTLGTIKADPRFKGFALVKQSRLSVMPVPPALDRVIRKLTGLPDARQ